MATKIRIGGLFGVTFGLAFLAACAGNVQSPYELRSSDFSLQGGSDAELHRVASPWIRRSTQRAGMTVSRDQFHSLVFGQEKVVSASFSMRNRTTYDAISVDLYVLGDGRVLGGIYGFSAKGSAQEQIIGTLAPQMVEWLRGLQSQTLDRNVLASTRNLACPVSSSFDYIYHSFEAIRPGNVGDGFSGESALYREYDLQRNQCTERSKPAGASLERFFYAVLSYWLD